MNEDAQILGGGCLTIIVIVILATLVGWGGWYFDTQMHQSTTAIRTNVELNDRVNNADNIIAANKAYFEEYNSVVAQEQNLKTSQASLDSFHKEYSPTVVAGSYGLQQQEGQLQSTVDGQKAAVQSIVAEFNSRSDEWDQCAFKNGKLPAKLDPSNPPTVPLDANQVEAPNTTAPINPIQNQVGH